MFVRLGSRVGEYIGLAPTAHYPPYTQDLYNNATSLAAGLSVSITGILSGTVQSFSTAPAHVFEQVDLSDLRSEAKSRLCSCGVPAVQHFPCHHIIAFLRAAPATVLEDTPCDKIVSAIVDSRLTWVGIKALYKAARRCAAASAAHLGVGDSLQPPTWIQTGDESTDEEDGSVDDGTIHFRRRFKGYGRIESTGEAEEIRAQRSATSAEGAVNVCAYLLAILMLLYADKHVVIPGTSTPSRSCSVCGQPGHYAPKCPKRIGMKLQFVLL